MNEDNICPTNYFIEGFYNEPKDIEVMDKLWEILIGILQDIPHEQIAYIGLYGSQNYKLNNRDSDIDCECFIFPGIDQILFNSNIFSTTIPTSYGTCVIKDIRLAFDEIRKSSPNVLECFATKYCLINREYQSQILDVCNGIDLFAILNKYKLLKGLQGLWDKYYIYTIDAHSTKYYANFLRLYTMINEILDNEICFYSYLLVPKDIEFIKQIKNNPNFDEVFDKDYFENLHTKLQNKLNEYFHTTRTPELNLSIYDEINAKQKALLTKYIKLTF